ncbi:malate dehydrogenase (quinone) [Mesoterricola sediminis]|uniref:Probable malate:quinone oxidoreductase n=1 Tax=Mesoterricola sediminis TaxID=2927980 RepID=A0AA48KCM5_9BACT|nr:malate dehydrogenase (quinone) [Mesoterricola sediminis]BDU75487.1 putative malate:quinone oxidoreductase 2 [Mesoterricola sediminis]
MSGNQTQVEVAIVGGGIVSATLATLLAELQDDMRITVFERLGDVAEESSQAMNNAGTGHAANCELNYTPEKGDGSVDIAKALTINGAFEVSLQFWSHLVERGIIPAPSAFLNPCPHLSFVWGEANTRFLRTRHARLSAHPMFADMRLTEDRAQLAEWMPLVMEGRDDGEPLAATRVDRGTDLDFGALSHLMFAHLKTLPGFQLSTSSEVRDIRRDPDGRWRLFVEREGASSLEVTARFVFLGAGGGALPLLLKTGIEESLGYGGFPVSGQWLVCKNPDLVRRHATKVYGKATIGAPPMSVPHLDTRIIGDSRALLFGPYAGFTTKYLKEGSYLDLFASIRGHNVRPMLAAGWDNLDLTRYLIGQVLQSPEDRVRTLRTFVPTARMEDWDLEIAGQRVQIIKRDPEKGGKLEFGTELVAAADGSLAALLGASPGASTCAATMVGMILRCFPEQARSDAWMARIRQMVPSHGHDLSKDPDLLRTIRDRNDQVLGLG